MSIQAIIQDVTSVLNVIVLAVGYYFLVRLYREWIHQSREERIAGGRPMVVVAADYGHLPEVHVVVRNFTKAPAKEITFDFSTPVESPGGAVLSELPYFEKGLPFLEPEGEVSCYWGSMPALLSLLKGKGLKNGIRVTTRYKDLASESYESEWTLNPLLFEGAPIEASRGMDDLVKAVEKIPEESSRLDGRGRETGGEGGGNDHP
ncbi:MAG: hypothetical protein M3317_09240 [Actinomycetota bacterium]|nr:hypothetical protein [Actinomycetota bacterium]